MQRSIALPSALVITALITALSGVMTAHTALAQERSSSLKPGVDPGEVVVLRRVDPAPVNRVDRRRGPVLYKADLRRQDELNDSVNNMVEQNMEEISGIALSDSQAANVRSTPAPARRAHMTSAAQEQNHAHMDDASMNGTHATSDRLMNMLGTDSGADGTVGGAISGLKETLGKAMGRFNRN